jgi:hypothetical protein
MTERWINRLTVIGPKKELTRFLKGRWKNILRGRFWELQETMRSRWGFQFETESSPILSLERLSRRWPQLIFVLECENETKRTKGLVKAKAGVIEQYQVRY